MACPQNPTSAAGVNQRTRVGLVQVAATAEKGRLAGVNLAGDPLHLRRVNSSASNTTPGHVAARRLLGEGVDEIERQRCATSGHPAEGPMAQRNWFVRAPQRYGSVYADRPSGSTSTMMPAGPQHLTNLTGGSKLERTHRPVHGCDAASIAEQS